MMVPHAFFRHNGLHTAEVRVSNAGDHTEHKPQTKNWLGNRHILFSGVQQKTSKRLTCQRDAEGESSSVGARLCSTLLASRSPVTTTTTGHFGTQAGWATHDVGLASRSSWKHGWQSVEGVGDRGQGERLFQEESWSLPGKQAFECALMRTIRPKVLEKLVSFLF